MQHLSERCDKQEPHVCKRLNGNKESILITRVNQLSWPPSLEKEEKKTNLIKEEHFRHIFLKKKRYCKWQNQQVSHW